MRTCLVVAFMANLGLAAASLIFLPRDVAIHFGSGGHPDSWAPREFSILFPLFLEGLLFVSLLFVPALVLRAPPKWINLPHKDHWLQEENRLRAARKMGRLADELGAVLFAFLFFAGMLGLQANLSRPVRFKEEMFLAGLLAFLAHTVWWCVRVFRAFRLPEDGK